MNFIQCTELETHTDEKLYGCLDIHPEAYTEAGSKQRPTYVHKSEHMNNFIIDWMNR